MNVGSWVLGILYGAVCPRGGFVFVQRVSAHLNFFFYIYVFKKIRMVKLTFC